MAQPIREVWVVTLDQKEISALFPQTSFCGEPCGGAAKCQLFSQATISTCGLEGVWQ